MYFFDLGLTPFEAGKQVGSSDLVKKNRLFFSSEDSQQIPQEILEEKKAFAAKCEKICRTVYPSILEEMEGFCSSSGIAMEEWSTRFLLSMPFRHFRAAPVLQSVGRTGTLQETAIFCRRQLLYAAVMFFIFQRQNLFLQTAQHQRRWKMESMRMDWQWDLPFYIRLSENRDFMRDCWYDICWNTVRMCRKRSRHLNIFRPLPCRL